MVQAALQKNIIDYVMFFNIVSLILPFFYANTNGDDAWIDMNLF
jgi:hypothetical protein